jgi:undecaprenyl-diphosphatase
MTLVHALILGLIEGITEFLPISSTAHLIVASKMLGLNEISPFFTIVVQLGALCAVVLYFWKKLWLIAKDTLSYLQQLGTGKIKPSEQNLPVGLSITMASLPIFVVGFLLRHQVDRLHNSLFLIALTSIAVAVLLYAAQKSAAAQDKKVTARNIISMGLYQVLALFPGTSRSGIVIAGGLFEGLSFKQALEYSFLMSVPALGVAGLYELIQAVEIKPDAALLQMTAVATLVAFISALAVIHGLLKWVRKIGFTPFVLYRIVFGIVVLWLEFALHN